MIFELYEGSYGGVICLKEVGLNTFDTSIMMMQRIFMIEIDGLWIYTIEYKIVGVDDV